MWKYIFLWVPMVFIAIANGLLRDISYGRRMRELRAHQLSTGTGIILLGIYIAFVMGLWPPTSAGQAIAIGLIWCAMTILFEFGFGRFVAGHPWERLLQDYNILAGRVWPAILVWVAMAPYLIFRSG
jgi:hypothetical protein